MKFSELSYHDVTVALHLNIVQACQKSRGIPFWLQMEYAKNKDTITNAREHPDWTLEIHHLKKSQLYKNIIPGIYDT